MTEVHHKGWKIVRSFEAEALRKRPLIVKIADFLTSYFGTVGFLVANVVIYGFWILANEGVIPGIPVFDPYPYSFMNSFVSIEAIILTVIVLMSQNREGQRDVLRNELGLQVELISEKEITKILQLLKQLLKEQDKLKGDPELTEMTEEIDTSYIERKLEQQLNKSEDLTTEIKEQIAIKK
jgi:uncharacterized membrane protein